MTRPGRHKWSCIDWIITNGPFVSEAIVSNVMISDHYAVECIRKKSREYVKYIYRDVRDYKKYNLEDFSDLLRSKLVMYNYMNNDDPNTLWDIISRSSYQILEIMCPFQRYKQREILTPWMTPDI